MSKEADINMGAISKNCRVKHHEYQSNYHCHSCNFKHRRGGSIRIEELEEQLELEELAELGKLQEQAQVSHS